MQTTFATLKRRVATVAGKALAVEITKEELEQAINDAIDEVSEEMPYYVEPDESVTLLEDTYEYDISALGFAYIHGITMADSEGDYPSTNLIPRWHWYFVPGPTLKFDERMFTPTAGRLLRIEGHKFQSNLDNNDDILYISAPYVVNRAAATLLGAYGSPRESIMLRAAEDARQRSPYRARPDAAVVR